MTRWRFWLGTREPALARIALAACVVAAAQGWISLAVWQWALIVLLLTPPRLSLSGR